MLQETIAQAASDQTRGRLIGEDICPGDALVWLRGENVRLRDAVERLRLENERLSKENSDLRARFDA